MSDAVTDFIGALSPPWQREVAQALHDAVYRAIPDATDRLQYRKPHYLKGGQYAAVISPSKGAVSLTIFNAAGLDAPEGYFEPGPPERKTIKIREGQAVDYAHLTDLVRQAARAI